VGENFVLCYILNPLGLKGLTCSRLARKFQHFSRLQTPSYLPHPSRPAKLSTIPASKSESESACESVSESESESEPDSEV